MEHTGTGSGFAAVITQPKLESPQDTFNRLTRRQGREGQVGAGKAHVPLVGKVADRLERGVTAGLEPRIAVGNVEIEKRRESEGFFLNGFIAHCSKERSRRLSKESECNRSSRPQNL